MARTLAERVWPYITQDGPIPAHAPYLGPCWRWQKSHTARGYAQVHVGSRRHRQMVLVHRAVLFLTTGVWGREGQHACDNRGCYNPTHLSWGTRRSNAADGAAKGRINRGMANAHAKLTDDVVIAMRRARGLGWSLREIADAFHVSMSTVSLVANRRIWRHVA